MGKGGARVGAGRPQKPLHEHLLRGTFRPDRHGARPTNLAVMPESAPDWRPAKSDIQSLGERAQGWLADALSIYQFDRVEGQSLLLSLRSLTRLDALEQVIAREGVCVAGAPHALLAAAAREARVFAALWAALRLGKQ